MEVNMRVKLLAITLMLLIAVSVGAVVATAEPVIELQSMQFREGPVGPAPLTVQCTLQGYAKTRGVLAIVWNFGDGSPQMAGETVEHKFVKKGTYNIQATVIYADGSTEAATTPVYVQAGGPDWLQSIMDFVSLVWKLVVLGVISIG
jgi:hypothetical protein